MSKKLKWDKIKPERKSDLKKSKYEKELEKKSKKKSK